MLKIAHESLLTNRQVNSLILVTSIKNLLSNGFFDSKKFWDSNLTVKNFDLQIIKKNHFSKNSIIAITDTLTGLPSPCDAFSYPSMRLFFKFYFDCVSKFQKVIGSFKVLENICSKMIMNQNWLRNLLSSFSQL